MSRKIYLLAKPNRLRKVLDCRAVFSLYVKGKPNIKDRKPITLAEEDEFLAVIVYIKVI